MLGRLAGNVGKGLAAGLAGTAAMTVSSTLEAKIRERGSSTTPADAAATLLGIEKFSSEEAQQRFNNIVHWAYGTGWGSVRGLLAMVFPPTVATVAHLGLVWASEQAVLPALDVSPPATQWGAQEIAVDLGHHIVYAVASGAAYGWLDARS